MAHVTFDLQQLYQRQFGSKPVVGEAKELSEITPFVIKGRNPADISPKGSKLIDQYREQEIWLPIKFFELDAPTFGATELLLPFSVIKISAKKNIVKTALAERQGTVKELFSIEDYSITIKGFLIGYDKSGKYPIWPEVELGLLKKLFDLNEAVKLDNALTNIFIDHRVVIESLDLPEVEGGRKHIRPFSMTLESDTVFTLELK